MNKKTPKGKTPSLIGGNNGRPRKALIQRDCKCYRCDSSLQSKTYCIEIPKLGSFVNKKKVCDYCFRKILEQTKTDLQELEQLI